MISSFKSTFGPDFVFSKSKKDLTIEFDINWNQNQGILFRSPKVPKPRIGTTSGLEPPLNISHRSFFMMPLCVIGMVNYLYLANVMYMDPTTQFGNS